MKHPQRISPFLWFNDEAEDAARFYVSIFANSKVTGTSRYGEEASEASRRPKGAVMTVAFELDGQEFVALNGGPQFRFSEAVSFLVKCGSQEEIDYFWSRLSEGGDEAAQQCGWLKDKFGVSWQVVPAVLEELMCGPDPAKAGRVMKAILRMKKLDLQALLEARDR
jgi:predicted 3-demethylubiquinone-9 3-methyltransferase (glyoxalase superfamily)